MFQPVGLDSTIADESLLAPQLPTGEKLSAPLTDLECFALVHRLLSRAEMFKTPGALDAVLKEADGLLNAKTWLLESVREKADLVESARLSGEKIHLADLMTIASVKHAELAAEFQKLKGRIVFRGDNVRDQDGATAVFQELSSSPTIIHGINTNLAYGLLPGHKSEQADALQAYVQSLSLIHI